MLWTFCWKEPGEWTVHERKLKFYIMSVGSREAVGLKLVVYFITNLLDDFSSGIMGSPAENY